MSDVNLSKKLDELEKKMEESFQELKDQVSENSQNRDKKIEELKCRKNEE